MSIANTAMKGARQQGDGQVTKVAGYAIGGDVLNGIRKAAGATGVDFSYLMAQAAQESSFQPEAKANTSSATGLYQFLDTTWLSMVKQHGAKHGMADMADQIVANGRGGYAVSDGDAKKKILELRKDPEASAALGAEFALSNKQDLEKALGREVGATELYLAHFLGAGGATRFLKAIDKNASQSAAAMMPDAAAANKAVFYHRDSGEPRTVGEIYQLFSRSIEKKMQTFADLADGAPTGMVAGFSDMKSSANAVQQATPKKGAVNLASIFSNPTIALDLEEAANAPAGAPTEGPAHLSLLTMLTLAAMEGVDPSDVLAHGDEKRRERDGAAGNEQADRGAPSAQNSAAATAQSALRTQQTEALDAAQAAEAHGKAARAYEGLRPGAAPRPSFSEI